MYGHAEPEMNPDETVIIPLMQVSELERQRAITALFQTDTTPVEWPSTLQLIKQTNGTCTFLSLNNSEITDKQDIKNSIL